MHVHLRWHAVNVSEVLVCDCRPLDMLQLTLCRSGLPSPLPLLPFRRISYNVLLFARYTVQDLGSLLLVAMLHQSFNACNEACTLCAPEYCATSAGPSSGEHHLGSSPLWRVLQVIQADLHPAGKFQAHYLFARNIIDSCASHSLSQ